MDYSHVIGSTFGQLTIQRHAGPKDRMVCLCSCGRTKEARLSHLKAGTVKSCGCLLIERPKQIFGTHLQSRTPTYKVWDSMVRRCHSPSAQAYALYGGRGITVCARWRGADGFTNFLADMGNKPDGLSLDRIDNDKGYEPSNCRWADQIVQGRNRRTSTLLTMNGQTMTVTEWAIAMSLRDTTIHERLKRGWTVERALMEPARATSGSRRSA